MLGIERKCQLDSPKMSTALGRAVSQIGPHSCSSPFRCCLPQALHSQQDIIRLCPVDSLELILGFQDQVASIFCITQVQVEPLFFFYLLLMVLSITSKLKTLSVGQDHHNWFLHPSTQVFSQETIQFSQIVSSIVWNLGVLQADMQEFHLNWDLATIRIKEK